MSHRLTPVESVRREMCGFFFGRGIRVQQYFPAEYWQCGRNRYAFFTTAMAELRYQDIPIWRYTVSCFDYERTRRTQEPHAATNV